VSWTAPAETGGGPITGYRITPYLEGAAQTATTTSGTGTAATINGLANGSSYTFKVAAINAAGTGPDSAASTAVTPADTIFDLATPGTVDIGEAKAINVGVKFRSDVPGKVTGIRFYKAAANSGTHVGTLWTAGGEVLAQATFANETASGWQQVSFSSPVSIQANTTYVASYLAPAGHYSANGPNLASAFDNAPLHAEAGGGLYTLGATTKLPATNFENSNYWVDVLFAPELTPGTPAAPTATGGFGSATVNWAAPTSGSPVTSYVVTPYVGATAGTPQTLTGNPPATSTSFGGLTPGTAYTFTVKAANGSGTSAESAPSNAVTPSGGSVPSAPTGLAVQARNGSAVVSWSTPAENGGSAISGYKVTPYLGSEALAATTVGGEANTATIGSLTNGSSYTFKVAATNSVGYGAASAASEAVVPRLTIFEGTIPTTAEATDASSVMLGVKFGSTVAGKVRGVRFYKAAGNVGPHQVGLWTSGGSLLASATATNETATGWQEVSFPTPISIAANTMYVAGYLAPKGHYSSTLNAFTSAITNSPLVGLANSTSVNGLYSYRTTLSFPVSSYQASNYWVDVMFTP
jgi:hypothetical protein